MIIHAYNCKSAKSTKKIVEIYDGFGGIIELNLTDYQREADYENKDLQQIYNVPPGFCYNIALTGAREYILAG